MTNTDRAAKTVERSARGAHTTDGHPITEWVRHHAKEPA